MSVIHDLNKAREWRESDAMFKIANTHLLSETSKLIYIVSGSPPWVGGDELLSVLRGQPGLGVDPSASFREQWKTLLK